MSDDITCGSVQNTFHTQLEATTVLRLAAIIDSLFTRIRHHVHALTPASILRKPRSHCSCPIAGILCGGHRLLLGEISAIIHRRHGFAGGA